VYVGRAGSGFTAKQLKGISAELERLAVAKPPLAGPVPKDPDSHWVAPELVAEVRYKEITGDGLLRQPVFLRFRDDKKPEECVIEGRGKAERGSAEEPPLPAPSTPPEPLSREVPFTNLTKVFWPEEGYTKGDLIEYYRAVSRWMLPYLADRPLVLTRYPDGIGGKSFFQKDAPEYAHEFVRTVTIWSEDSQRELITSCATAKPRCSTSRTWRPSCCTSGRAASRVSSARTGASSTSTPKARRSPT
jgi:bifunctional non-homologous end joining protein LigD